MSYGRGRGRGGGIRVINPHAKKEPFVLYPGINLPDIKSIQRERDLTILDAKLQTFWKSSPYHLEERVTKKPQSMDIERFSDWGKQNTKLRCGTLDRFLVLDSHNFPRERIGGAKRLQTAPEEVRWNPDAGYARFLRFRPHFLTFITD